MHLLYLCIRVIPVQVVNTLVKEFFSIKLGELLVSFFRFGLLIIMHRFSEAFLQDGIVNVHNLSVRISHIWQEVQQTLVIHQLTVQKQLHVCSQV